MKRGKKIFYSFIISMIFLLFIGCSLDNFESSDQDQTVTRTISTAQSDSLTSFNSGMWEKADWNNGAPFGCAWNPNNISFSGSGMTITLNNTSYNGLSYSGGEYRTRDTFDYGTFTVSMSTFTQSGTVQSFFLYTGSPWDEIDVEKIGTKGWQYNYYKDGQGGHEFIGNGSTTMVWAPNYITYGGRTVNGSSSSLPSHPMQVMMNVWNHDGSTNDWLGTWNYSGAVSTTYRNFSYTPLGGGSTTTTSSYSSTTTSSGGSGNVTVRARGTKGGERLEIQSNGTTVATFTMSTSYANYSANVSGTLRVAFTNDDGQSDGMDIQVDYADIDGTRYQAENQATNTGVWQNDSCGGSNSEWLQCDGYIEFGSSGTTTTSSWSSTTSSGGSTTSTSGGGNIVVRARGETGNEQIRITANGSTVGTFTVSTSYQNYSASGSGTIRVEFTNDDGADYDVQVDYVDIDGSRQQAEDQATNTGVYQDGSCGGSYSEWLHCPGYIEFGGGSGTTTSTAGTTTSSGGWWWW
jgi:hypothetical protein